MGAFFLPPTGLSEFAICKKCILLFYLLAVSIQLAVFLFAGNLLAICLRSFVIEKNSPIWYNTISLNLPSGITVY